MKQYIAIITALLLVWPAYAASKKNKKLSAPHCYRSIWWKMVLILKLEWQECLLLLWQLMVAVSR